MVAAELTLDVGGGAGDEALQIEARGGIEDHSVPVDVMALGVAEGEK